MLHTNIFLLLGCSRPVSRGDSARLSLQATSDRPAIVASMFRYSVSSRSGENHLRTLAVSGCLHTSSTGSVTSRSGECVLPDNVTLCCTCVCVEARCGPIRQLKSHTLQNCERHSLIRIDCRLNGNRSTVFPFLDCFSRHLLINRRRSSWQT